MSVPFVDLKAQYRAIKPEIDRAMQAVVDNCDFVLVGGPVPLVVPGVRRLAFAYLRLRPSTPPGGQESVEKVSSVAYGFEG